MGRFTLSSLSTHGGWPDSPKRALRLVFLCMASSPAISAANAIYFYTQTFAQFELANEYEFLYQDNGTGNAAQLMTYAGTPSNSIPITFTYLGLGTSLPADLQGPQAAMLTLTCSTDSPVTELGNGFAEEPFPTQANDTLIITRDTPAGGGTNLLYYPATVNGPGTSGTNLLTMTFTGDLIGKIGGETAQLAGDAQNGDTVSFSSDFLPGFDLQVGNYSLNFTSWLSFSPSLSGMEIDSDGYFSSGGGEGTGSFAYAPFASADLPEPPCLQVLYGGAMLFLVFLRRTRGRRTLGLYH
jgi:hypothetical protein